MVQIVKKLNTKENIFLAIILFLKAICFLGIKTTAEVDTVSYTAINGFSMDNIADVQRTPVYPFFLEIFERISKDNGMLIATVVQFLISCVAVIFLYKLLKQFNINHIISNLAVAFFALSVSTNVWDRILLTESLSLSCVVFYCYLVFNYIQKPNVKSMAYCALLLLVMIFLRPTFALFLILTIVFLILYAILKKPKLITTMLATTCMALVGVIVLGYMSIYQQKHGQFSLSSTLINQQVATIIKSEMYVNAKDKEIIQAIDNLARNQEVSASNLPELEIAARLASQFDIQQIVNFKNQAILSQLPMYLYDRAWVVLKEASTPFGRIPELNTSIYGLPGLMLNGLSYLAFSVMSFGFGIQIAIVAFAYFMFKWLRKKDIDFILLGVWVYIAAIYVSALYGTCGDYARTAIAAVPIIIIGCAVLINEIYIKISCKK